MRSIAVDVGGVLASKQHDGEPEPGCLVGLSILSERYELYILSMCGKQREVDTIKWLTSHSVDLIIPTNKWYFVRFSDRKSRILKLEKIHFLLDDRPKHLHDARMVGKKGVHYIGQHNDCYGACGYINCYGWNDVIEYFMKEE